MVYWCSCLLMYLLPVHPIPPALLEQENECVFIGGVAERGLLIKPEEQKNKKLDKQCGHQELDRASDNHKGVARKRTDRMINERTMGCGSALFGCIRVAHKEKITT